MKVNVILYLSAHKGIFQEWNVKAKPFGYFAKSSFSFRKEYLPK